MLCLYEELSEKIARAADRGARDGARRDLGLVLFADRDALYDLWKAADRLAPRAAAGGDSGGGDELRAAAERLRPLFGERP
jgi:hypothetical protein